MSRQVVASTGSSLYTPASEMKAGTTGALIVLIGGAALGGALFAKDKAQLLRSQQTYEEGRKLLGQGKPQEALEQFTKSLESAIIVGGTTGNRPAALDVAQDARKAIDVCEALIALQAGDVNALATVDRALKESGARALPKDPLQKVETKRLAQLAMTTAETLEKLAINEDKIAPENAGRVKAEYHALAAQAFVVAAKVAKEGEFDWVAVAEQGEHRARARALVAEALAANAADDGARAREFAEKAQKELAVEPFQGTDEPTRLKAAIRTIAAESNDRAKVNAFEQEVAALAAKVGTNDLGTLLGPVEAVKPPELEGGHRAAAELDGKKILATKLLAKVKAVSIEFQDMVLAGESGDGKVYVDRTEVTNEAYKKFVDAKKPYEEGRTTALWGSEEAAAKAAFFFDASLKTKGPATWPGPGVPEGKEKHPVAGVSALEAKAFAAANGKRLPTYDEWLGAAGRPGTAYPWGDDWREDAANAKGTEGKETTEVGKFPSGAAKTGAVDLVGNVREIVEDGGQPAAVGGSYSSKSDSASLNSKAPVSPSARPKEQGFRCARELRWKAGE